jgi:hypothetical protein
VKARQLYFAQAVSGGPIKIGIAEDPDRRRRELQGANPERLVILAVAPGRLGEEWKLHRDLAAFRVSGEWFTDCEEVRAAIDAFLVSKHALTVEQQLENQLADVISRRHARLAEVHA